MITKRRCGLLGIWGSLLYNVGVRVGGFVEEHLDRLGKPFNLKFEDFKQDSNNPGVYYAKRETLLVIGYYHVYHNAVAAHKKVMPTMGLWLHNGTIEEAGGWQFSLGDSVPGFLLRDIHSPKGDAEKEIWATIWGILGPCLDKEILKSLGVLPTSYSYSLAVMCPLFRQLSITMPVLAALISLQLQKQEITIDKMQGFEWVFQQDTKRLWQYALDTREIQASNAVLKKWAGLRFDYIYCPLLESSQAVIAMRDLTVDMLNKMQEGEILEFAHIASQNGEIALLYASNPKSFMRQIDIECRNRHVDSGYILSEIIDYMQGREREKRSLGEIINESRAWHQDIGNGNWDMDFPQELVVFPKPPITEITLDNLTLSFIPNSQELRAESRIMHHCVASYWKACLKGSCLIWSLHEGEKRIATIETNRDSSFGEDLVRQIRGPYNAEVEQAHQDVILKALQQIKKAS